MTPVDLQAETERGYHWSCSACEFSTRSRAAAMQHCEEASGDFPAHEHTLHELNSGEDKISRNRARRVVSCRDDVGRALNARVSASSWRFIDGRWEIRGVTAIGGGVR